MPCKHWWIRLLKPLLAGTLFLAGCPSASEFSGGESIVASMVVEGAPTTQPGGNTPITPSNAEALNAKLIELVNLERTRRGLQPVTPNPKLMSLAEDYAEDMIRRNFFDHTDPDGRGLGQRAIEHGYVPLLAVGENLAGGQNSPEWVMNDWMKSTEGHRENILSPQWTEIGVAVRIGGAHGIYWVQEFGNPP
ncbi:MAG: CAP domain-containing protein [Phycisphaerae bacterium]